MKQKQQRKQSQPGGSQHLGSTNLQEGQMAAHNGSTNVSTTPLPGVLYTKHHVSHVCINLFSNVKHALGVIPGNDLVGHGLEPLLHLLQHVLYVVG
jgi:hypothetical protein